MIYLEKKSIVELPTTTGSIIDSASITDKTKNTYSARIIDEKIAENVPDVDIPTKTSELENDSGFVTSSAIPTKTSELENDSGFITSAPSGLSISSFVPTKHVILQNTNVNPNASKTGTTTVTKSGYYPIGIVGVNSNGIKEYYMSSAASGTANIYYNATNGNPNTITCWLSVWVLWAK